MSATRDAAAPMLPRTLARRRTALPVVVDPLAQSEVCGRCPKLCATTCPVSAATGREAVAPWRISATVLVAQVDGWTQDGLRDAASCTGCGACTQACLADVSVPQESRAARAQALEQGVVLPAAAALRERLAATGSPLADQPPDRSTAEAAVALVAGCAAHADGAVADAARWLLRAAGAVSEPAGCCGAVAVDLGLRVEGDQLRADLLSRIGDHQDVVVATPSCAQRLRESLPRARTAVEWLDDALAEGALACPAESRHKSADDAAAAVVWHDPCTLARGLGVLDAPRRVLEALGIAWSVPSTSAGADTVCSGGGAGYPLVDPAGARAVASARAEVLTSVAPTCVTACASAERRLRAAGLPTEDLLVLAARRLQGS